MCLRKTLSRKAGRFIEIIPFWLWRILQLLALLYGATCIVVPIMGAIGLVAFPQSATPSSADALQQMVWLPPIGVALLWLAYLLNRVIGDALTPDDWIGVWLRGGRALLLPKNDDRLHDFTVRINQPVEQVVAQLEALPTPRHGYVGSLTRRIGQPMASVEGGSVTLTVGITATNVWLGQLRPDGDFTMVDGRVQSTSFQWTFERIFNTIGLVFVAVFATILLLAALLRPTSVTIEMLVGAAFCVVFLAAINAQLRLRQFREREHERALERFWHQQFGATIELKPRVRGLFDF